MVASQYTRISRLSTHQYKEGAEPKLHGSWHICNKITNVETPNKFHVHVTKLVSAKYTHTCKYIIRPYQI